MQIHLRASHLNLEGGHSAQPVAQCWHAARDHTGIGNYCHVAFQRVVIVTEKIAEVCAADFFFALDHKMHVHRQFALLLDRLLKAENVRKDLAFVVRCTTRKNVAILQNRLKRRRIPKLQRIWRLHIVMSVDQNGSPPGPMLIARPNDRMTRRGNQLCLQTNTREFLHEPMRTFGQSFGVLAVGRDTWKPQERIQIFKVTWTHAVNVRPTFRHLPLNCVTQIEMGLFPALPCASVRACPNLRH